MLFLGKLLNMRGDISTSSEEMSLIEHLEDLRKMLIRIAITLFLGVIVCFFFRNELMGVMRKPIDDVWSLQLNTSLHKLPVEIDAYTWERAGKASSDGALLSPEQREHLYETLAEGNEDFPFHVQTLIYYRSALSIDGRKAQQKYIEAMPGIEPKMREQLLELTDRYHKSDQLAPDPDASARRRLVFMQSLHPTEGFMLSFKLALYAGIALTFPFLLYFILQFVMPGLHAKEKKALFPALFIGFALFLGGGYFAYELVLPRALEFFSNFSGGMGISNDWRIGDYISFTTQFVLIFGLAFELPVLILTLVLLDFLSYKTMAKTRAYAIVGIVIAAAVITPTPDVLTLALLAVPMYILYEISIICAWFIERSRRKKRLLEEEAERKEQQEYAQRRAEALAAKDESDDYSDEPEEDEVEDPFATEPIDSHDTELDNIEPKVAQSPGLHAFDAEEEDEEEYDDFYDEYHDEDYFSHPEHISEALREQNDRIQKLEMLLEEATGQPISNNDESELESVLERERKKIADLKQAVKEDLSELEGAGGAIDPEAEAREAGGADFDEEDNDLSDPSHHTENK